jgi:cobalt-zinc-cadmium efflux system membrane fusion protein
VEIGDPRRLWIVADVPENAAGSIPVGRAADVTIPGAAVSYRAVVDGMGPVVDGEQRRLPLYLRLLDTPKQLAAGMLAEIRFRGGASGTISVPAEAVLIKDGAHRIVYVQRPDGKFEPRPVSIGDARGGRVVITHGLRPGESIVVHGALLLDSSAEQQL